MKYETKISLPFYKITYAVFFVVILSLVRGVTDSYEIGIALEPPMAVLAAVFCADTYTQEITSKRSEIQRLCPMKKRVSSIYKRILIQVIFLMADAVIGYGLFILFQSPRTADLRQIGAGSEGYQFFVYIAAVVVTLGFWGILSNLISCLFRNMWMGICGCLILWLMTNSSMGDRLFGVWNLFSYTFRDVENSSDFGWICGKIVCLGIGMAAAAVLPVIIAERG